MNKKLIMTTLLASSVSLSYAEWQVVKEYDFTTYSAETVNNLTAEATASPAGPLWYVDSSDIIDAATNSYKRFKGVSGYKPAAGQLYANNEIIKELECLSFPSMDAKDFTLRHNYGETSNGFQLGSSNKNITLLGLEPGQQIEFSFTSSNTSARGFSAAAGLTLIDQVFPVHSEGEVVVLKAAVSQGATSVSLKWDAGIILKGMKVLEDIEIQETPKKIAYFYNSAYNAAQYIGTDNDPLYPALSNYYDVEKVDVNTLTAEDVSGYATGYDAIFVTEAIGGTDARGIALKGLVGVVPMVNTKSFFYSAKRWVWATGANPDPKAAALTVTTEGRDHKLFLNTDIDENGNAVLFDGTSEAKNYIQGWNVAEGDVIASDVVLAMAGTINAVHEHPTADGANYVLIPLSSDGINTVTENALRLLVDACEYVIKGEVSLKARKPAVTSEDGENGKLITIASETADAVIYYTLDGTEPTKKSTVYTEPFILDKSATVKAMAVKADYVNSPVITVSFDINAVVAKPAVSTSGFGKGLMVSLMTSTSDATVYYTTDGTEPTKESDIYSAPFYVGESVTIKAFAVKDGYADSPVSDSTVAPEAISEKLYMAYFYNSTYTIKKDGVNVPTVVATEQDEVLASLKNVYEVELVDVNALTAAHSGLYANGYDILYVSESIGGTHVFGLGLKDLVGIVPMVNTKAFFYTSGRWSFAAPKNPAEKTGTMTITEEGLAHDIFKGIEITEGKCTVFNEVTAFNQLQAWDSPEEIISSDLVLSTVEAYNCVHLHKVEGEATYVLVPLSSDDHENINANGIKLLENVCEYVTTGTVITSVKDVVNNGVSSKEVSSVELYNVSGIRTTGISKGVNIIKTTYKDGSVSTVKVIR